ncbi:MAG: DUF4294 domain-containing protein [Bacteroidales bacterium]|nr:DUF4294 domain-containing protein [Bacteroidales bacterium]
MKKIIIIFSLISIIAFECYSQEVKGIVVFAKVKDGDTIPIIPLKEVNVYALKIIKNKRKARRFGRLVRNVKKVYPYAKIAGIKLDKYNDILLKTEDEHDRRKIMKQAEDEIKEEFGEDLKKLNFSQGKILIKLIDRETENSSFKLVQELRGKFTAFFYQAFARLFGYNLKVRYDAEDEDRNIEMIVKMIECGMI